MPEPETATTAAILTCLRELAGVVRVAHHLTPEGQQALADLLEELSQAVDPARLPPHETAHLAESAAQLARSLGERHDATPLTQARERLEKAILAAEARAPFASGVAQRLLNALADLGI